MSDTEKNFDVQKNQNKIDQIVHMMQQVDYEKLSIIYHFILHISQ